MLHGVRDVDAAAVDADLREGLVEQLARRTHEGLTGKVLLVPRLLTDQHHVGITAAGAEDRLGRVLVQPTCGAGRRSLAQAGQVGLGGNQVQS